MDEGLETALEGVVRALEEAELGLVRSVTLHLGQGTEHAYNVVIEEEQLPQPGTITVK